MQNRIKSLDLARGIALFLMVFVHVLDTFATPNQQNSPFAFFIYMVSTPLAATVFIFALGFFFQISKNQNLSSSIIRGIKLFILGYLFNFVRMALPILLAVKQNVVDYEVFLPDTVMSLTLQFDIFQFAGITLILMALIKKYLKRPVFYLILAFMIMSISPWIENLSSSSRIANFFLDMLSKDSNDVSFPLFPWLIYPIFGMSYGYLLQKHKSLSIFFKKSSMLGLIIFSVGLIWLFSSPPLSNIHDIHKYAIGRQASNMIVFCIGAILCWLPICHFLTQKIPTNIIFNRFYFWSKHVTAFYIIQWIFVGWFNIEVGEIEWSFSIALIVITIVLASDRILTVLPLINFKKNILILGRCHNE